MSSHRLVRRRYIALIALFGLLFQQLAMASYSCPLESGSGSAVAISLDAPPCHRSDNADRARCHEHCHPLAQSADHAAPLTVPAALLPPTTWFADASRQPQRDGDLCAIEVVARATAPPFTIRDCTFQL